MFVHVLPFLAVSAIVVITPGVDMALVTRNALLHGRAAAQAAAIGVNVGILVWTFAAALGLAAVIAASAAAFTVIKLAGAVYLVYLGVQALRASRRDAEADPIWQFFATQYPGAGTGPMWLVPSFRGLSLATHPKLWAISCAAAAPSIWVSSTIESCKIRLF